MGSLHWRDADDYRFWGATVAVGFVGPSVMEFHYQRSFSTEEPFTDGANTVHFLLTMCLIIGVIGLLITYFNTHESEKQDRDAALSRRSAYRMEPARVQERPYWVALGISMFVFASALLGIFRPLDLGKIDDRRIRQYRLSLRDDQLP